MTRSSRTHETHALDALLPILRKADGSVVSAVSGASMGAPFASAAELRIDVGPLERVQTGDIVAFAERGRLVAHRVVHVGTGSRAGYLITKGDASRIPDPPVDVRRVAGRVSGLLIGDRWEPLPPFRDGTRAPTVRLIRAAFALNVRLAAALARMLRFGESLARRARSRLLALVGRTPRGSRSR